MEKEQRSSDKHRHRRHRHHSRHHQSSSSSEESGDGSPTHSAPKAANAFANDGSFMEMFKRKMEEEEKKRREEEEDVIKDAESSSANDKKPLNASSFVRTPAEELLLKGTVDRKLPKPLVYALPALQTGLSSFPLFLAEFGRRGICRLFEILYLNRKELGAVESVRERNRGVSGGGVGVGKRRGGARLALKTGVVAKKQKQESEAETGKGDAWTKYMAEVKKYKAHQCGDDDKTRPLVK
ncbi:hypothetical protein DNTS_022114 [Danionella cerebrum]|uniref:Telomerase RNA component interacting RNase n=1 Tax=Danionella cerebrum TaxID=2873325 RepID=A0A553R0L2_9TELE|nr:hypothetical protein DNTS_022114 [Danionella translucida]